MKVLMISTDRQGLIPSSAVAARWRAYGALVERLEVVVLAKGNTNAAVELSPSVRVYALSSANKIFWLGEAFNLARGLKFDLITCQDPFFTGWLGWLLSRVKRVHFELQIHTDLLSLGFINFSLSNRFKTYLALWLLPRADSVRVVSNQIKQSLLKAGVKLKQPSVVLPIFVDQGKILAHAPAFDLHARYPQFKKIIVLASRLTKEKNLPLAAQVFKQLTQRLPDLGLVIVGEGPERKNLEQLLAKLSLSSQVKFEGWQTDVISYFKTADLFLQTSVFEGYGLSLLQAVVSGCPAVSTPVGIATDYPDQIKVGQTALELTVAAQTLLTVPPIKVLPQIKGPSSEEEYSRMIVAEWKKLK